MYGIDLIGFLMIVCVFLLERWGRVRVFSSEFVLLVSDGKKTFVAYQMVFILFIGLCLHDINI